MAHLEHEIELWVLRLVDQQRCAIEPSIGGDRLVVLEQVAHDADVDLESELVRDLALMRVQLDTLEDFCSLGISVSSFVDISESFTYVAVLFFKGDDFGADLFEGVDVDFLLDFGGGEFGDGGDVLGKNWARCDDSNTVGEDCVNEDCEVGSQLLRWRRSDDGAEERGECSALITL